MRTSGVSFPTIARALAGDEIRDKRAAEKLSEATGGAVSVAELMHISAPQPSTGAPSHPPSAA